MAHNNLWNIELKKLKQKNESLMNFIGTAISLNKGQIIPKKETNET